jgi:hypothetical protein
MNLAIPIIVGLSVVGITVLYKISPHRNAGDKKPIFSLLPKYKKNIKINFSEQELESKLADFGFKMSGAKNGIIYFHRGQILGDFSVNLMKVKLGIKDPKKEVSELTLEAKWVAAFDTGDFWSFTTQLANKLENA